MLDSFALVLYVYVEIFLIGSYIFRLDVSSVLGTDLALIFTGTPDQLFTCLKGIQVCCWEGGA